MAEVVICGAGIAGIAAAYELAVVGGLKDILLVDRQAPLSLTSDKSTEAYRNFWPGPDGAMIALINRSIDRLETLAIRTGNAFAMNRRGYLFASADPARIAAWEVAAAQAAELGAGPLRVHVRGADPGRTYSPNPAHSTDFASNGADLILDPDLIRAHFPFLTRDAQAVLHVRRAGWLSAQQLGRILLEAALFAGVEFRQDEVVAVELSGGKVAGVQLRSAGQILCQAFINAAGPHLARVAELVGQQLPIFNELHMKVSIADTLTALPRHAPLVIWSDPQSLEWTPAERTMLEDDPDLRHLLAPLPGGAHLRPDGEDASQVVLMLWEYHTPPVEAIFPIPEDLIYPEIVLRGMAGWIPAMRPYLQRMPRPFVDGGYYTKTRENRPLACRIGPPGSFIIGGLSGFGIMASLGLAELLRNQLLGGRSLDFQPAFEITRYEDPAYLKRLENWGESWQL